MSLTSQRVSWNPEKFNHGLHYYQFIANLNGCNGSCNASDDPSSRICVSNKTENVNINDFNVITRINESKSLTENHNTHPYNPYNTYTISRKRILIRIGIFSQLNNTKQRI